MAEVDFYYNSDNIKIQCNKYEKIKEIFQKFYSKVGTNQNSFVFIYNGDIITNKELTFNELANEDDKKRNKMNVLVSISTIKNTSQFIYECCEVENDEMKEYAEMTILYAIQKYPDNDYEKCKIVSDKFEEKYGGYWTVSFIKIGDMINAYNNYFIKVKYGEYIIKISRTHAKRD